VYQFWVKFSLKSRGALVYIKGREGGLNYWQQGRFPGIDAALSTSIFSSRAQHRQKRLLNAKAAELVQFWIVRGEHKFIRTHAARENVKARGKRASKRVACATNKPALYIFILFAVSYFLLPVMGVKRLPTHSLPARIVAAVLPWLAATAAAAGFMGLEFYHALLPRNKMQTNSEPNNLRRNAIRIVFLALLLFLSIFLNAAR
jgi:hypothetical protein